MYQQPGYATIVVCQDGSEFGIFCYGGQDAKYRTLFPKALIEQESMHDNATDALTHLNAVWMRHNGSTDNNALMLHRLRQTIHEETAQWLM